MVMLVIVAMVMMVVIMMVTMPVIMIVAVIVPAAAGIAMLVVVMVVIMVVAMIVPMMGHHQRCRELALDRPNEAARGRGGLGVGLDAGERTHVLGGRDLVALVGLDLAQNVGHRAAL